MTPAAKETPTTSGGSSEDWETKEGGNDRREAQVWQADVTQEMASRFGSVARLILWRMEDWTYCRGCPGSRRPAQRSLPCY